MAITVNTNMASFTAQKALNSATNKMNTAMERMSTGLRINSSKDDAAGMAVSTKLDYKVSSLNVAKDNAQMGASMLDTTEGVLDVIKSNLVRVRDLTEQAANGTYGSDALAAIQTEVSARLTEITRVAESSEFNGKKILNGDTTGVQLQVGITGDANSQISLNNDIFADATATGLIGTYDLDSVFESDTNARAFLSSLDTAIDTVTERKTLIGGSQSAITSAMDAAEVMSTNLTSSSSLIKDADIAEESSNYIKNQILQQASATLLATANQAPSIAVNLV